jgi:arginine decarboxylase
MNIYVVGGKGCGKTSLSAFDDALKDAGVYNYNIVVLSSIIPTGAKIIIGKFKSKKEEYGHKLFVVKSEIRSKEVGVYIGAAVGWFQLEDGKGTFVEHTATGNSKAFVEKDLKELVEKSLLDLCKRRGYKMNKKRMGIKTSVNKVKSSATCAIVVAVYQAEGWK